MNLRELDYGDSFSMLEWMHDFEITYYLKNDYAKKKLEDCNSFIEKAREDTNNIHYAVCDQENEYMGTISLKNVNRTDKTAEYAVILRKKAIGTGIAGEATKEILRIGFEVQHLNKIYLNVLCDNKRALRFYEKFGFIKEGIFKEHYFIKGKFRDVMWLRLLKSEWEKMNVSSIK